MRKASLLVFVLFALALVVSACSPAAAPVSTVETGGLESTAAAGITAAAPTIAAAATAIAPTVEAVAPTVEAVAPTAAAAATSVSGSAVSCANAASADLISAGQTLYATCAGCHGAQGEGAGSFPALAGNAGLTAADLSGALQKFLDPNVHPFVATMTNQDVASVLSYVQATFNNSSAVCPEAIDALRTSP